MRRCQRCGRDAACRTWDWKWFCWACARHLNFDVYDPETGERTSFSEKKEAR